MRKAKKRNVVISILISFFILVAFLLWFNRDKLIWLETVTIIKEVSSVDLKNLEVEYKYENTLRRIYETEPRHGSILVSFTCSPEYADEVLFKYKDRLKGHLKYNGEELTEEQKNVEDTARGLMALAIGVSKEELNGKSLRTGFDYQRPFNLSKQNCKCATPDYIHVQELDNGDVTVYICYCE